MDGEPWFNKDQKGIEIEKFITHWSCRKYPIHLEEPHGEIKTECRERQDLEHILLCRSLGAVLWGSWAKAGLVNLIPKNRVVVSYMGIFSKGCIRVRH